MIIAGVAPGPPAHVTEKPTKASKQPPQKKDVRPAPSSLAVSEMKVGDRPSEKDKKKDIPPPRMQYDDTSRVEKAKKRSVVKQTEARNRVELFRHLPQYEYGNQLHDLESKFFNLDSVHPAVHKVLKLRIMSILYEYFFPITVMKKMISLLADC